MLPISPKVGNVVRFLSPRFKYNDSNELPENILGINHSPIHIIASNQGSVVGYRISSFAFKFTPTTPATFVYNILQSTNIHSIIWLSIIISSTIYIYPGFTGAVV